ncbi:hypothetical protein V5799_014303 [Amblyomma americanum]|uniref:Uncharacterized protein n=1 Tax=Amblyomma americanum TaxID=6943 RepID=A0AAQ4E3G3_AMBAM
MRTDTCFLSVVYFQELHLVAVEPSLLRGLQQRAASLPPPYEAVATSCDSPMCRGGATTAAAFPLLMAATAEEDPPTYEEALLLIRGGPNPTTAKTTAPETTQSSPSLAVTVTTGAQEDLPDR